MPDKEYKPPVYWWYCPRDGHTCVEEVCREPATRNECKGPEKKPPESNDPDALAMTTAAMDMAKEIRCKLDEKLAAANMKRLDCGAFLLQDARIDLNLGDPKCPRCLKWT
jgi:hypothetical protein